MKPDNIAILLYGLMDCGYCAGTGLVGDDICTVCKGSGAIRAPSPGRKCARCEGTGHDPVGDYTCRSCFGTGWAFGRSANV